MMVRVRTSLAKVRVHFTITCLFVLLSLAGCRKEAPLPTSILGSAPEIPQEQTKAKYEEADCPFDRPQQQSNMKCGKLTVPVDRSRADSAVMQLSVITLKSSGEEISSDPVLLLFGVSSQMLRYSFGLSRVFGNIASDRDLIILEQRGAGPSKPVLDCPELTDVYFNTLMMDPNSQEANDLTMKAREICIKRWAGEGTNLSYFSTASAAADLMDLRRALRIKQWNILAVGYGVRMALSLMQIDPQGVRTLAADSVELLDDNYFDGQAVNADRALSGFFQLCAKDGACNEAFPDLQKVFYQVVDDLNSSPKTIEVADLNAGKRYQVYLDGYRLIEFAIAAVGAGYRNILPELPRIIYQLKDGKTDQFSTSLGMTLSYFAPEDQGIQLQLYCVEQLAQMTKEKLQSGNSQAETHLAAYFNRQLEKSIDYCKELAGTRISRTVPGPIPDIPMIIMNGELNPWSSSSLGKQLVKGSSHATIIEFAGGGQSSFGYGGQDNCGPILLGAFLSDPKSKLDTSCAQQKVAITWITLK